MAPDNDSPPLFVRGPGPGFRLFFFAALSIALIFVDARFGWMAPMRSALSMAIWPFEQAARAPGLAFEELNAFFTAHVTLKRDNESLLRERVRLYTEMHRARALEAENVRLRGLLDAPVRARGSTVMAEIVSVVHDPFSRKVFVNRGNSHGVTPGAPVVDTHGVVGQVIRVLPFVSEMALVTDRDHSVPVEVERNRLRAIVFGEGGTGLLEVRFMPISADIRAGDLLVTSGIDGVYPPGLPVARVLRVDRIASLDFPRIVCAPLGGAEQSRELLILVGPPPAPIAPTHER